MTGEITLGSHVLPVGGIKEKVLSAKQASVKEIIIPKENLSTWNELEKEVKEGLNFYFVKNIEEVLPIAFPSFHCNSN